MKKYHKQIGFEAGHVKQAEALLLALQDVRLSFTSHALTELLRERQAEAIGKALKEYSLNFQDVFELAFDGEKLEKLGFRVKFNENDIIFILSREKRVVTCWTNNKKDLHYTLDYTKYCTV